MFLYWFNVGVIWQNVNARKKANTVSVKYVILMMLTVQAHWSARPVIEIWGATR